MICSVDLAWGDRDGDGIDELLVDRRFDYHQPALPGYRGEGRCAEEVHGSRKYNHHR
ncbi:MAG: hypothetical protein U1E76_03485 [Planctomycetota bacterium]